MALWIGYRSETTVQPAMPNNDQAMLEDLPVLEDQDVLQNFEPLKTLPAPVADEASDTQQQEQM